MAKLVKLAAVPQTEVDKLKELLDGFLDLQDTPELRTKVRSLIPVIQRIRMLGCSLIPSHLAQSARDRIIVYLRQYPMTLIDGDELLIVSGIGEWARRVRELRVQFGWTICSGVTFKDMVQQDPENAADMGQQLDTDISKIKPDQYVLVSVDQDRDAAHRWNILNTIRKKKVGVKEKILEYFRENVGKPISIEELKYLAGKANEWPRRVRELRTESGWPILTRMQGRDDLPVGTYVLDEDKQAPEHDRKIPDDVRIAVLERDDFKCVVCGWDRSMLQPHDPRKSLELHHLIEHKNKGQNTLENLVTICNVHHDHVHAGRLAWNGTTWVKVQR
ncbi:HNH endonuclease [Acetobacter conturbans]|uniref:HNH endonuclease n=1 Tax=Acetobacter conturbans TaxID=1737472 RepID=A0ABX0K4A9_9PROT|nr:HNH endonuclease signature motif containing protein [Acetobacter conturbans]NHN89045.1 HNH endonuclease [Acetobacter conturbans]